MIKAVIIEDEPLASERLSEMINEIRPDIDIVKILQSVTSSINYLSANKPDLIFLDIHLSDGNSFQIFQNISGNIPIIFTTAYDKYAINAFKLYSIDYLLKPISKSDLEIALQKFENLTKITHIDFEKLINELKNPVKEFKQKFLVQIGNKLKTINVEQIACFYAENKSVYILTKQNNKYICEYTLDKLEQILDDSKFFRINRKVIINFESIQSMETYSKGRVIIEIAPKLPNSIESVVSIERSHNFRGWLER